MGPVLCRTGGSLVEPNMSLSVLLCDDQPILRYGLRTVLEAEPDIAVVGEVGDGADLVRETVAHQPDVLVLDPQVRGFAGIGELREAAPGVAVLVFTGQDLDASFYAAVHAGARGYLLKNADDTEIVQAVRCVAAGSAVFGSRIATRLGRLLTRPASGLAGTFAHLTARERQVLDLMASGASNSAISNQLHLAGKTISNHISTIFAKLRVSTRSEAIVLAREGGLGNTNTPAGRPPTWPAPAPGRSPVSRAAMDAGHLRAAAAGMSARR
jgi:DNA-binding NarL/FixJ family response regulator